MTGFSKPIAYATCVAGLALAHVTAFALEGRVEDAATGQPLANVTLSIVGRTQSATSDSQGRVVLIPDPKPPFDVLALLPGGGYLPPVKIDALPADGPLVIKLAIPTDAVVVMAEAAPGIRTAPAAGTTLVSSEDLRSRASRNLTQTLENVPGVSSVSEGHASAPAIRGLAQARTLVMIDGARVTAERRIGPSAAFVDPFVLDGVEVARGPGSVAYGSDALGGVIMARTRRPQPGSDLAFDVLGEIGTGVPQARVGLEVATGLGDKAGLLVSGHYRDFDDYDSPDGEVLNSGSTDYGLLTSYTQVAGGGLVTVNLMADFGRDVDRPRTNSNVVRFYYPEENSLRLTTSYESGPLLAFDATELSLFVGDSEIVTDQDTYGTATTPRSIARADVRANDFGLRATAKNHWRQASFDYGLDLNGRFNLEAEDITIDYDLAGQQTAYNSFTTIEDARRIDLGAFFMVSGAVARTVSLAGGLRYDSVKSTNEGGYFGDISVDNGEPSGYAAATFGPFAGFSTTAQYTHGFRDARLSDRFFRGVTGAGFITGNPNLEPETSDQYDLSLRYVAGRWRPALYVFHYDIDDLIERYEDPLATDFFYFRNAGKARIQGVELEIQAELPAQVSLVISGSMTNGELVADGSPLDDIPPDTLIAQARKTFGSRGWVQLRTAWYGKLDEPGPNEVALDSKTVIDAAGGWRINKVVELQLLVRNLLDKDYLLTADGRSPLAPGLSAVLTGRFTF